MIEDADTRADIGVGDGVGIMVVGIGVGVSEGTGEVVGTGVGLSVGTGVGVGVGIKVVGTGVKVGVGVGVGVVEMSIWSITFFRIVVMFSLLANPAETIDLADVTLPSVSITKPLSEYRQHLHGVPPIGSYR